MTRAGQYCLDAIALAIAENTLELLNPATGAVISGLSYGANVVEIRQETLDGGVENLQYSIAGFFAQVLGDLAPEGTKWKLLGKVGVPWLECTMATQYYLQELGKDGALRLQRLVFRDPSICPRGQRSIGAGGCSAIPTPAPTRAMPSTRSPASTGPPPAASLPRPTASPSPSPSPSPSELPTPRIVQPEPTAGAPEEDTEPCPNGMVGPGPDADGSSGCYVPGYEPTPAPQEEPDEDADSESGTCLAIYVWDPETGTCVDPPR